MARGTEHHDPASTGSFAVDPSDPEVWGVLDFEASGEGYASFDDADTPAEVDAVFRIQRRIALAHFFVFISVTLGVGLALVGLQWAAESQVFGGFSPGFVMAGVGLYLFFVVVGAAATTLANAVEDRMMGARSMTPESQR